MAQIDLSTAKFGTVVYLVENGATMKAVVVVEAREKSATETARRPSVFFEDVRLGRRDIMDTTSYLAFTTIAECEASIKLAQDEAALRDALAAIPADRLQAAMSAASTDSATVKTDKPATV